MRARQMGLITAAAALVLAACAQFPELDETATPGVAETAFPDLLPIETLIATGDPRATPDLAAPLLDRVAALDARADALRGPVIDAETRARMSRGIPGA